MNQAYFGVANPMLPARPKRPVRRHPLRRDTKVYARASARFIAKVRELALGLGAIEVPVAWHSPTMEIWIATPLGGLTIRPAPMSSAIFTRFDRPESARRATNCNPYSGKWNFHFSPDEFPSDAHIAEFALALRSVMGLDPRTLAPRTPAPP